MVSVLDVVTSKDLKHATVFLSVYSVNPEKKQRTFEAIVSDAKKIRYELSKVMRIRTVPELHFILDGSMDYGDKMDKLFKKIEEDSKG
jgi:ribosome-binding factor A